ncbi:DUF309 domain-containing protein [Janibacter alittae]|uniref:DUF309 domain-containing protein n=1 Tax=Janibacter alittae TaxID=3115209 RepID=A0ABZ2MK78_9MICO
MASRDRNAAGRAENARPRDGLGRPLSHGSAGVERVEARDRTACEALTLAQEYLDREMPFHAHEVLEEQWKSLPQQAPERALWQGLAQLAVGLTHQRRGNPRGARTVTGRGSEAIAPFAADPPHGIDVSGLVAWARAVADAPAADAPVPHLMA